jgi:hypothetical protein
MTNAKVVIGGLLVAVVAGVGTIVNNTVLDTLGYTTGLWTILPIMFAVAAVMGLIIAAFGAFL